MTEGNNKGLRPMGGSGLGPDPERSHDGPFRLQPRDSGDNASGRPPIIEGGTRSSHRVSDLQIAQLAATFRFLGLEGEAM